MLEAEVVRTDHGYPCRYTPTIMSGPVFRWGTDRFEVSASRYGVVVQGCSQAYDRACIEDLCKLLALAARISARLYCQEEPQHILATWDKP